MSWQFNFWNNYDLGNDNDDLGNDYDFDEIYYFADDVDFGDGGYAW